MNTLKYTITKFDNELKQIDVVFEDGSWAQVRLVVPLPKSITELEDIIKQFAAPVEAIEAQKNSDVDLTYITAFVGTPRECERLSLNKPTANAPGQEQQLDPEVEAALVAKEQEEFLARVSDALVKLGVTQNAA